MYKRYRAKLGCNLSELKPSLEVNSWEIRQTYLLDILASRKCCQTGCSLCDVILVRSAVRSITAVNTSSYSCYIQHKASNRYLSWRRNTVLFETPRGNNSSDIFFRYHSITGYDSWGRGVNVCLFSDDEPNSQRFLVAKGRGVIVEEFQALPIGDGGLLDTRDLRVFLNHMESDYHLFEVASMPNHYMACDSKGRVSIQYVRPSQIYNDDRIKFKVEFPDRDDVLHNLEGVGSSNYNS